MNIIHGDIWDYHPKYPICITINAVIGKNGLVMGKGIALDAKQRYPKLPIQWAKIICRTLDHNVSLYDPETNLIGIQTKIHWRNPSTLSLIEQSLNRLVMFTHNMKWEQVYLPPLGCGNGGLDWELQVKPLMQQKLNSRFTVVLK